MYVCQTITFENLDVASLFSYFRYLSAGYGSESHVKLTEVTGAKKVLKIPILQCKTSIGNNSSCV